MRSSNSFDPLFFAGVGIIIFFYIGVLMARFKDENFDFQEHKWIAFGYMSLMVLTIVVWRYLFDTFFNEKLLELLVPQGVELG